MPAAIDRRLGHTRVEFSELVELRASLASEVWTRATNLSERGLHLRTDTVFAPGTVMEMRLPLPRVEQSLEVKGRVAWSREDRDPGMGIELVDLSETDLSLLRREVMEGQPRAWSREVKVWFEGTREPTRAVATGTGANVQLVSDLGFLKIGSQVVIYGGAAEAEPLLGTLSEVALRRTASVPQLVLSVEPNRPELPPDETWTHWPPPPVRAIAEETEEIIIEAPMASLPAAEVHVLENSEVSGSILAHARPEPVLELEPSVATVVAESPAPEPLLAVGNRESKEELEGWQLGPGLEESDWQLRSPAETLQLSRARSPRRLWLWWLAAALMAGTAAASMSYTDSWIRVRERLSAWWGERGEHRSLTPARLSLLPPPVVVRQTLRPVPPVLAPEAIRAPAAPAVPASEAIRAPEAEPAPTGPTLEVGARRLSIPIQGSLQGSQSYKLADPAGLAINLPNAKPVAGFGDYEIQKAGFRFVWLRRRGTGLQVRVFFGESYEPALSLAAERLSVQLREGAAPTP
jgi:uncharacterized protein (TIGR02266 family)